MSKNRYDYRESIFSSSDKKDLAFHNPSPKNIFADVSKQIRLRQSRERIQNMSTDNITKAQTNASIVGRFLSFFLADTSRRESETDFRNLLGEFFPQEEYYRCNNPQAARLVSSKSAAQLRK